MKTVMKEDLLQWSLREALPSAESRAVTGSKYTAFGVRSITGGLFPLKNSL